MSQPSIDGHVSKIGNFLRELYTFQDISSLYQTIIGGLGDVIDGDNIFIGDHDMENTVITGCAARHLFETPDFLTIVNSHAGEHPLWEPIRTGDQITRCISDHASARKWENTTLYREALGKEGIRDHLSIEFGKRKHRLMSVAVFRSSRGFSDRDHETMAFLIPHIGQALDNARLVGDFGILSNRGGRSGFTGVIHLNADGKPQELTESVRAAFCRFFPDRACRNDQLPLTVERWITESRQLLARGALEHFAPPFTAHAGGRVLELRIHRQRLEAGYLVTVRGEALGETRPCRLTPRETQVLHWLKEGKRNEEIGMILGMGVTTVKTHLNHIYHKLGVDNRTAAARFDCRE